MFGIKFPNQARRDAQRKAEFKKEVFTARAQEEVVNTHVKNALSFVEKFGHVDQALAVEEYLERMELRGTLADMVANRAVAALDQQT